MLSAIYTETSLTFADVAEMPPAELVAVIDRIALIERAATTQGGD